MTELSYSGKLLGMTTWKKNPLRKRKKKRRKLKMLMRKHMKMLNNYWMFQELDLRK